MLVDRGCIFLLDDGVTEYEICLDLGYVQGRQARQTLIVRIIVNLIKRKLMPMSCTYFAG